MLNERSRLGPGKPCRRGAAGVGVGATARDVALVEGQRGFDQILGNLERLGELKKKIGHRMAPGHPPNRWNAAFTAFSVAC